MASSYSETTEEPVDGEHISLTVDFTVLFVVTFLLALLVSGFVL